MIHYRYDKDGNQLTIYVEDSEYHNLHKTAKTETEKDETIGNIIARILENLSTKTNIVDEELQVTLQVHTKNQNLPETTSRKIYVEA